jgi:hypothetical protein
MPLDKYLFNKWKKQQQKDREFANTRHCITQSASVKTE